MRHRRNTWSAVGIVMLLAACGRDSAASPGSAPSAAAPTPVPSGTVAAAAPTGPGGRFVPAVEAPPASFGELAPHIVTALGGSLPTITNALTNELRMPRDVRVALKSCGVPNAFYTPAGPEIAVCWELLELVARQGLANAEANGSLADPATLTALTETVNATFAFFLLHEIGHALVHQLELPVTGREEDVVDQLAATVMLGNDVALAEKVIGGMVTSLALVEQAIGQTPAWDEHAMNDQRAYNLVCWVYGAAPERNRELVGSALLPEARAARCTNEWEQMRTSWERLLAPHTRS